MTKSYVNMKASMQAHKTQYHLAMKIYEIVHATHSHLPVCLFCRCRSAPITAGLLTRLRSSPSVRRMQSAAYVDAMLPVSYPSLTYSNYE